MKRLFAALAEVLFLLFLAPLLLAAELAALLAADLVGRFFSPLPDRTGPVRARPVSVVIPTWNGRSRLAANLPSVVEALSGDAGNEILVVDNASDDGTEEFLRRRFPSVRVLRQKRNLGFGPGSNAGVRAARNGVVVLLNDDMRVAPDFLAPLVEGFRDERVFAVTAQIFFSDPHKRREETGLTRGRWENGRLVVGHVVDERVKGLFPTFYAGGGSTAYDRAKFLELGGFDPLYEPFYVEDVDLSYQAWKRGWINYCEPRSVVCHEHRGTIGRKFSSAFIDRTLQRNNLLFVWKNIQEPGRLAAHFCWTYATAWARLIAGASPTRADSLALLGALARSRRVWAARVRARRLARVSDTEALRRPLGGYFRDRFARIEAAPEKLNVLFVSPYPIEPPLHGGGVFMNQTVRCLARLSRLYLFCLLEREEERETNRAAGELCAGAEFMVRRRRRREGFGALTPYAVEHFRSADLEWRLHRSIYENAIDVLQLEYTQLAGYGAEFKRIATFLFEHDVYFQSVARSLGDAKGPGERVRHFYEYLRALRFERRALRLFDGIQVCTAVNRRYLESFLWSSPPIEEGLRAGIDIERYEFVADGRAPDTLLFVGNFRHPPNRTALEFFLDRVFPIVRAKRPTARTVAVGAHAPPEFERALERKEVEYLGEVEDIRGVLARYAVFLAPILSGSGVRVKLLEAFASGIPCVSTRLGAEGLTEESGRIAELADSPAAFAEAVVKLLEDPDHALALARRARQEVERNWDMAAITRKLERRYRETLAAKIGRAGGAER